MKIVVKAMSRGNELAPHTASRITGKVRGIAQISDYPLLTRHRFPLSPTANETGVKCLPFLSAKTDNLLFDHQEEKNHDFAPSLR